MKIKQVGIDTVTQDPNNKRLHNDENYLALRESLRRFGQQIPIVVDENGRIIKGNGTWQAAVELGWTQIYIHRTTLQGKEAELFSIADNRIAELSEWDYEQLSIAMQSDGALADQLLTLGWTEQLLAPLKIATWTADEVQDLKLPPPDPNMEPCIFLDFTDKDMADISAGIAWWRQQHPAAEGKPDAWCVAKICSWYAKQSVENA